MKIIKMYRLPYFRFFDEKEKNRVEWLRGIFINKNKKILRKFHTTGSGIISSLSQSNGIIQIDEEVERLLKGIY